MPLNDPIGSSAFDVLQRNTQDFDKFTNQTGGTVINRTGTQITPLPVIAQQAQNLIDQTAQQLDAAVTSTGWMPAGGFATGFTFTARNQVGFDVSGNTWSYNGNLPFTVPAGTVPSEPTYTNRGDAALRSALAPPGSDVPFGGDTVGGVVQRLADAEQRIIDLPDEVDAAGTAAALVNQHNSDAAAHPALSAFITSEANRAEAAAEAAAATGRIYETSAAGQADAGLVDGDYFWVVSALDANVLELWRKGATTPTDTSKRIVAINSFLTEPGTAWVV